MPLDSALAAKAIETHVAKPLGLHLEEAASGILEIANANMLRILRLVSIQRGYDPRGFSLVAFGGAGPLHATKLAEQISIRQVIIPRYPALFSALGLLYANPSADFTQTVMLTLGSEYMPLLQSVLTKLETQAEDWFKGSAIPKKERQLRALADVRYLHQNYELTIELPLGKLNSNYLEQLYESFHAVHKQTYGHSAPGETIQVVNVRLRAVHERDKPKLKPIESVITSDKMVQNASHRNIWLRGNRITCPVYPRAGLRAGHHLTGPLVVQEREATILVEKGWVLTVDSWGNLLLNTE